MQVISYGPSGHRITTFGGARPEESTARRGPFSFGDNPMVPDRLHQRNSTCRFGDPTASSRHHGGASLPVVSSAWAKSVTLGLEQGYYSSPGTTTSPHR